MDSAIITEIVGMTAGALTTISFLPQVLKTYKSRSAKDLSMGMLSLFTFGIFLWAVYGVILMKPAIIIANTLTLLLAATLLYAKFKFKQAGQ